MVSSSWVKGLQSVQHLHLCHHSRRIVAGADEEIVGTAGKVHAGADERVVAGIVGRIVAGAVRGIVPEAGRRTAAGADGRRNGRGIGGWHQSFCCLVVPLVQH